MVASSTRWAGLPFTWKLTTEGRLADGRQLNKMGWVAVYLQKCLAANARPEWDFRCFSKAAAFSLERKAKAFSICQGLNLDVWETYPKL